MAKKPEPPKDASSIFDSVLEKGGVALAPMDEEVSRFSSGLNLLDAILGGGLAEGRMTEIFGPFKSGKTELARAISARYLSDIPDSEVWYFDQEFALDKRTMDQYPIFGATHPNGGKRFRRLFADNIEEFFKILFTTFKRAQEEGIKRVKVLIVLDSQAALKSSSEVALIDPNEKLQMLPGPRLWSDHTGKLRRHLNSFGAHFVIINQLRDKPGSMAFADPESPGGQAIKFYADYRLYIRQVSKFSYSKGKNPAKGFSPSGFVTKITVKKNKLGQPERTVEFPITFTPCQGETSGINEPWAVFLALSDAKLIKASGGAFVLRGFDERFSRKEWVPLYRELQRLEHPALSEAIEAWVERQLRNDFSALDKPDGSDDDDSD